MGAPTVTPRSTWIDAGLRALASGGPEAVRVETLAASLSVTRGGFYGFFKGRAAFLDELLDTWERRATEDVITQVESEGGDAHTKAVRAGQMTFDESILPIDLAVRDWARRDRDVARRLKRVDERRMEYLRSQLRGTGADALELEARCLTAFAVAIGHHFVVATHGSYTREDVLGHISTGLFTP